MLIDPKMKHFSSDQEAIIRVINVAIACAQYKAAKRPKMHDMVPMLLDNISISELCKRFDYEDLRDVTLSFSDTTSSFIGNEDLCIDECRLLDNTHEIEMNPMAL